MSIKYPAGLFSYCFWNPLMILKDFCILSYSQNEDKYFHNYSTQLKFMTHRNWIYETSSYTYINQLCTMISQSILILKDKNLLMHKWKYYLARFCSIWIWNTFTKWIKEIQICKDEEIRLYKKDARKIPNEVILIAKVAFVINLYQA